MVKTKDPCSVIAIMFSFSVSLLTKISFVLLISPRKGNVTTDSTNIKTKKQGKS